MAACKPTAHDFEKFDEATIFCRRCGEQRVMDVQALIAMLPQPIYLPCPWPHYPAVPYGTWVYPVWSNTSGGWQPIEQPTITYRSLTG